MKRSREPEEDTPDAASPAAVNSPSPRPSDSGSLPAAKITELDPSSTGDTDVEMRCLLPPHKEPLLFTSYSEYETHYQKAHTNRCLECRKNFPSTHLLGVHIEEAHDCFVMVKRERGERTVSYPFPATMCGGFADLRIVQYSCFVEGCDRKCSTPQKRRLHLIDKHMYPKNFFFAVTRDGIDGRRSLLNDGSHRRRRSSVAMTAAATGTATNGQPLPQAATSTVAKSLTGQGEIVPAQQPAPETRQSESRPKPDVGIDDLTGAMSALQFVPPSIRFGRGGRKAGFAKR